MKKLILLRHAKTIQSNDMDDRDRYLTEEGKNDIKKTRKFFNNLNVIPDLVICSTAKRAKETLDLFMKKAALKPDVIYEEIIYENNENKIINFISKTDKHINNLLAVGHIPSVENMVTMLTSKKIPGGKFNTSGIAIIRFDFDSWDEIEYRKGVLEIYNSPDSI